MNDKDKLLEIIDQTIPYFYPEDGFLEETKPSLEETFSKANKPTLRALNYLKYLVEDFNFNYLNLNTKLDLNNNINIKNKFYAKHKMKMDKVKEIVYAKISERASSSKEQTQSSINVGEVEYIEDNAVVNTPLDISDRIVDYFTSKPTISINYEEMKTIILNIKKIDDVEKLISNFVLNEKEALNLIKIAQIHKHNPLLYSYVFFLLANHISPTNFYYLEDFEEIIDLLEYYLFNNLINNNLIIFNLIIEVFKKVPLNFKKIIVKIINFLELILKNIYLVNASFKLKCFSVLLIYKDQMSVLSDLIEVYEYLDKQMVNGVELRLYLICKLFESCVVNNCFMESNYVKLTNQIFPIISVESLIENIEECYLSRIAVISCCVYYINTGFKEKIDFFKKVFLKLNRILTLFPPINISDTNPINRSNIINLDIIMEKCKSMNISKSEEILYKNILKTNNLKDSLFLLFKQITFHFLKAMKNPKILFKTNGMNLLLTNKERIKLINNLISKSNNLSYNMKYQLCEYLDELGYDNVFDILANIPTKKSFLKMLKYIHSEDKTLVIMRNYINLLKEGIKIPNFIFTNEVFESLSKLLFYELDKSIIKLIKIPINYLYKINNLYNAVLIKHYSKYNPQEFISLQNEIYLILINDGIKIKKNCDFYISIIKILTNILESKEVIYKTISYLQNFIYYEKYCECICLFLKKYYFIRFKEDSYYNVYINSCLGIRIDTILDKLSNSSNTSSTCNDNSIFIKKAIIQQIKHHQQINLIDYLINLLSETNESLIAELLTLLINLINNENIFEFISKNQNYFFNLFLKYKNAKINYLNYKLVFKSTYLGAMLPKITLPILVVHSSYNYELLVKHYAKDIFNLFDEIFNYSLSMTEKNNSISDTDIEDNIGKENSIIGKENIISTNEIMNNNNIDSECNKKVRKCKNIKTEVNLNFILKNDLLYKLFSTIEPTKQRLTYLNSLIQSYDPIKCIYIYQNLIKCNLNNFERKSLISKIKEVIILQDKNNSQQIIYWMIKCISALKGRKELNLEEVSESEYERVKLIVDGYIN